MRPGDIIKIVGDTCPMYPDDISPGGWEVKSHIGYAVNGTVAIFMGSEVVHGSRDLTFARVLMPGYGPVWVRSTWVKEVVDETR